MLRVLALYLLIGSPAALAQTESWERVAPSECDFTVRMPTQPIIKAKPAGAAAADGVYYTFDSLSEEHRVVMTVVCQELHPTLAAASRGEQVQALIEAASQRTGDAPKDVRRIDLHGHPGIAYSIPEGKGVVRLRLYVVRDKFYELNVGDLDGNARGVAEHFFQSFSAR